MHKIEDGIVVALWYGLTILCFQIFEIPMELRKAVVMYRQILAAEHVPQFLISDGKSALTPRKLSDARAFIVIASVCRYWRRLFATCDNSWRRKLWRSFCG